MLWQMLIWTLLLNFSSTCEDELLPMFAECKKHFQWRSERARYPVPRLDWFRSLWVDVAPMDFIRGSSFRSVQLSLFDPKNDLKVYNVDKYHMCHNASPFPTMVGSLSYPSNNNFWAEPWLRAPQAHRIHEEMLWWPGLSKGKLVGHPEGQSQQSSPMSRNCNWIWMLESVYTYTILYTYIYIQIILLILISCWSLFSHHIRLWGLSGWMRRNPASPTKKEGHLV